MKNEHLTQEQINERHNYKMAKKKAVRDKMLSNKIHEKGLLMVHTGKGKGKSTAAMGLGVRAIGNGIKIGIVQFVKGKWQTGEREILQKFPDLCTIRAMGEGFTWDTQDRQRDIEAAENAWRMSCEFIDDPDVKMVILDELNIALRYEYLDLAMVIEKLQARDRDVHVVITGRNAPQGLIEIADTVTEMTQIKHHFRADIKAQIGIEF